MSILNKSCICTISVWKIPKFGPKINEKISISAKKFRCENSDRFREKKTKIWI